jgi:hypothetical protein
MLARLRSTLRDQWLGVSIASVALFVALGGPGYAAGLIDGSQLENRSVPGKKLAKNTLTGKQVKEAKLGRVPTAEHANDAGNAQTLAGIEASGFQRAGAAAGGALTGSYPNPALSCPTGTSFQSGFCFENSARAGAAWLAAAKACATADRRLATPSELVAVAQRPDVDMTAAEWTTTQYMYVNGSSGLIAATTAFEVLSGPGVGVHLGHSADDQTLPYRCVVDAGNP